MHLIENSKHSHGRYITIFEKMPIKSSMVIAALLVHFYMFIM